VQFRVLMFSQVVQEHNYHEVEREIAFGSLGFMDTVYRRHFNRLIENI